MIKYLFTLNQIFFLILFSNIAFAGNWYIDGTLHKSNDAIPKNATFAILERTLRKPYKASFTVRINRRVSKLALKKFARKIKQSLNSHYQRIFITYFLDGQAIGAGAWAVSHFEPTLKVKIMGFSVDEYKALVATPKNHSGQKTIGVWLFEQAIAYKERIYKEKNNFYYEMEFKDGSKLIRKITLKKLGGITRVDYKKNTGELGLGEYMIINKNGDLDSWDSEVYIGKSIRLMQK